jgi:IS30 family transposase
MKKPWTDAEREELRTMYTDKANKMADICTKLNRSKFAVMNEVRRIKVTRRVPKCVAIG